MIYESECQQHKHTEQIHASYITLQMRLLFQEGIYAK